MKVAVIGGGINGLCCARQLALAGVDVTLFERDAIMQATSSASSKLLHGGLRYLEQGEFRLVKEALKERRWWLKKAPKLTKRLPILYPIYEKSRRSRLLLKIGLYLYDRFAGKKGIGQHRWLTKTQTLKCSPYLKAEGLKGAYLFFDGQMDDNKLGHWMADECQKAGVKIIEHSKVLQVSVNAKVLLESGWQQFDYVVNVAGPWSQQLLEKSALKASSLDLVRGSHLLLPPISRYGHMLEVPNESRVVFVLPYQGNTLLGTTEVRQTLDEPITCSHAERDYLLNVYNHYFIQAKNAADVITDFAGVRPLLAGSATATKASREYELNWQGKVLTVSGGKWTTARALGKQVTERISYLSKIKS